MPEIHYALGGSNVYRWTACPGSIKACEGLPNETTAAAEEGTRVHSILEEATRRGSIPEEMVEKPSDVTSVQLALDAIDYQRGLLTDVTYDHPEELFMFFTDRDDAGGSADHVVAGLDSSGRKCLVVLDYKNGRWDVPADSWQLAAYLIGAGIKLGGHFDIYRAVVIQPNGGIEPVRSHDWTREDLGSVYHTMRAAAELSDLDSAPRAAGEHCRFCLAKSNCETYAASH